jgi:AcrR family transcriptional regulator
VTAQGKEHNRTSLLRAARDLVAERGYRGASVEAIAERAGLTTGAIYSIFGSKIALLTEVLEPAGRVPSFTRISEATAGDLADVFEAFGRAWAATLRSPRARPTLELALELQLATLRDDAVREEARVSFATGRDDLATEITVAAERRGETLPMPAVELASALIATMQGLAQLALLVDAGTDLFATTARRLISKGS